MLHFSDSKSMARALRKALAERQIDITHADALELVARQFGFANWNMLSARIEGGEQALELPEGWIVTGQGQPNFYRVGIDPALPGTIKIETADHSAVGADAFGTLMQSIAADDYRGRAVRITAELRCRGADRGALWMRVDPQDGGRYLRFDNMLQRKHQGAIHGDVDWTERSIVLDVPQTAGSVHYGVLLKGSGQLWARNFRLEPLEPDTAEITQPKPLIGPTNLEFRTGN